MIRKIYRERIKTTWEIVEKETVDEIIYRTTKQRNCPILELMASGGIRIVEPFDFLQVRWPSTGKDQFVVCAVEGIFWLGLDKEINIAGNVASL